MVRNEEKYQLATHYRKQGFTYAEIAKICGVSKSTVSAWLAGKRFSKQVKQDNQVRAGKANAKRVALVQKARQTERTTRYKEAVRSAETEYKHYKSNPQFIAGLMLYLAKGDHNDPSQIRLTGQDITTHRIFRTFLMEYLGVEKQAVRFWLLLPSNVSEKATQNSWSKVLKLPAGQFGKTQVLKQEAKRLHNGTGNTIIGNTVLKHKLIKWIELATKELSK